MLRKRTIKCLSLLAAGAFIFQSGCTTRSLLRNMWTGFGVSLGGIPAAIVSDFIVANLGLGPADDAEDQ